MEYSRAEIIELLATEGAEKMSLFREAAQLRDRTIGKGVYLRGLIEYSNICAKNCFYCGIRSEAVCQRYTLSEEEVLEAARYSYSNGYGSVVIQAGERSDKKFISDISRMVRQIKSMAGGEPGITLSLGEQSLDTYREWKSAGASRYLLRIESSNTELYRKLHPGDGNHSFESRLRALENLRKAGFQVGTGVMIGVPFQTVDDLAGDLIFMRDRDIDMCGMGPYIVSAGTPLAKYSADIPDERRRVDMTLKMTAVLRLMMPDINIAASTALQTLDADARLAALNAGANIIMPNLTPQVYRDKYFLYDNKPTVLDNRLLEKNIRYFERGDSERFARRSCREK